MYLQAGANCIGGLRIWDRVYFVKSFKTSAKHDIVLLYLDLTLNSFFVRFEFSWPKK